MLPGEFAKHLISEHPIFAVTVDAVAFGKACCADGRELSVFDAGYESGFQIGIGAFCPCGEHRTSCLFGDETDCLFYAAFCGISTVRKKIRYNCVIPLGGSGWYGFAAV